MTAGEAIARWQRHVREQPRITAVPEPEGPPALRPGGGVIRFESPRELELAHQAVQVSLRFWSQMFAQHLADVAEADGIRRWSR